MTKTIARKDAIMLNIAIAQAKLIDMISQYPDDSDYQFEHFEDGDFHIFEIKNESTGAVLSFSCPKHRLYFQEVEDALPS